jgi:tripartite-type tricarboxylate transporter receptor subunit TctC
MAAEPRAEPDRHPAAASRVSGAHRPTHRIAPERTPTMTHATRPARIDRRRALRAGAALAVSLAAPAARAQPLSDRPIRILVGAPAGGTADLLARTVAEPMAKRLGQPVIVDNRPGGLGAIVMDAFLAAPRDGHTLLMSVNGLFTEIPHTSKPKYDPLKDVRPLVEVAGGGLVLVGHPGLPARTFPELVAWVKANAGKVSFASYTAGTLSHVLGLQMNALAGLDMQHVAYKGSPPALQDVMGGQVPLMFDGMPTSKKMVEAGKIQAFGVAARKRSPHLPNVPTLAEQGYPELDFGNWVGIIVASGVPSALVQKINAAVDKSAASPKVRDRLLGAGFDLGGDETAEQMAQSLRADFERNAAIVKSFDIRLNQ